MIENSKLPQPAALVTGGAKRIGREIAIGLAKEGWDIALHYFTSNDDARQTRNDIRLLGRRCELFGCNLMDTANIPGLVSDVFQTFPHWSLLINNASIYEKGNFIETDETLLDRHIQLNFKVPYFLCKAFVRHFRPGQGQVGNHESAQIINILDTKVNRPDPDYFAYGLSKSTLHHFTLMAAHELAPQIRVNAVAPGVILPPKGEDETHLERLTHDIPMQTNGTPQDVVSALIYLTRSPFVTGQVIHVGGGEHI